MPVDWRLLAVPLLIALNAFFVAAEYAVVAIRSTQIEALRVMGRRRSAGAMSALKKNPAGAIGAIQVCITMTNLMLGWLGEPAMSDVLIWVLGPVGKVLPPGVFHVISISLSFLLVTLLTVVFSELLPKALTLRYVLPVAWLTAVPVLGIRRLVSPLVWIMNGLANAVTKPLGLGSVDEIEKEHHTMEEIKLIAVEAAEEGVLTPREQSLILNSLALGRKTAEQIMVPRVRVAYLDLQRSMNDNVAVINQYLYSRLPLCDGGMDRIVGVVYAKELLTAMQEQEIDTSLLSLIARPAVFAPTTITLDILLNHFREQRTHLIFLVDEHGGVEGIVTLIDVADEILEDLTHPAPNIATDMAASPADIIPGNTPLHELAVRFQKHDWGRTAGVSTVAGLIMARLGRIAKTGEVVVHDGVKLQVVASDHRQIKRVRVELLNAQRDEE